MILIAMAIAAARYRFGLMAALLLSGHRRRRLNA